MTPEKAANAAVGAYAAAATALIAVNHQAGCQTQVLQGDRAAHSSWSHWPDRLTDELVAAGMSGLHLTALR